MITRELHDKEIKTKYEFYMNDKPTLKELRELRL